MVRKFLFVTTLIFCLIALGCGGNRNIEEFDSKLWKSDRHGCAGQRLLIKHDLKMSRDHLMGLSENDILRVLGKPDRQELYRRSQKFFVYYITPAAKCEKTIHSDSGSLLKIRFDALGEANEIIFEDYLLSEKAE